MKKKAFHFIASFILIASILLPIGVSFTHALHKHEHKVCTAKSEHHIHTKSIDCSFFHYLSPIQTTITKYTYEIFLPIAVFENPVFVENFNFITKILTFSVRGPPLNDAFLD